ncbi:MAG: threonine--tRNA ligase [Bacteroidia bacterium]|jgi:threonyl-tRNA synthetase|nr:threonine--tRNA ligase [Bacteroidia bacterium]MBP7260042.1 threonine--tRNA ligase [Bacteroidia bacterium]MBP9179131.1 threonine--tRNA ligase [Bacteroidia bacterium]MBP9723660.1 threonine--tRNA ligase [Bacteroidia bacterium]
MINITLPDGSVRSYERGTTALEIAKSISEGLARNVLSAKFNNNTIEVSEPLQEDGSLRLFTWNDKEGKQAFWHSSAHVLAQALEFFYPKIKLTIGPAIENGFYYDVDLDGATISDKDFKKIEDKMLEFAREKAEFHKKPVTKADALAYYQSKNNEFKVELIENLNDGDITFCDHSNFTDLCRGGHLPNTGFIKAVKLMSVAGAYWRGDEKNKQLTRVYGITFPKQAELEEYLVMLEEAKKRDHRKLGKELEMFTFDDDVGPGLPLWLPNGAAVIELLEGYAKKTEADAGYVRVKSPHIAKESMYIKSGHLPYYAESMFPPMEMDGDKYYLKAMNCPHHHKIFAATPKSYRDLPLRFAEYGTCYRYEQSGELFGLMRVRSLTMNDAHIYCTESQFEAEFTKVNDLYLKYFKVFGIDKYVMRFSKHSVEKLGQKYINAPELWIKTEDMVRKVLVKLGVNFVEVEDEAAFYGPKIDIQIYSAIGREFTLATNQVDFAQAERFDLWFTNEHNEKERPLIIHRAPLSTHERFIGFLLEHYAGNLPVWLSPTQVAVLPISDKYNEYAQKVVDFLKKCDIRASFDDRSEKIGRKIRDAETKKIPYMVVIGEQEMNEENLAVRKHGEGDKGKMNLNEFAELIHSQHPDKLS